eukprot:8713589-Ditylum_brightwellii.AAC.1
MAFLSTVLEDEQLSLSESQARESLQEHIQNFCCAAQKDVAEWREVVINVDCDIKSAGVVTERLQYALCEIDLMLGLDGRCDTKLKVLQSNTGQVCSCISEWMQSVIQKKGGCNKKAKYLNT